MLCNKENCTGCMACKNICPTGAISEKYDIFGFIYPSIENSKCTNCGLCERACPSINNKVLFNLPIKAYAAVNTNLKIRNKSSSGGAATTFAHKVIWSSGVVYGAAVDSNINVKHKRIEEEKDIILLSGTKYVESYIGDTYSLVKRDLESGRKVLFIGTPCQIGGLLSYLRSGYNNLITVSFICHGVPSQKFLHEEIINSKQKYVDNIRFRDNTKYVFQLFRDNKMIFNKMREKCAFYRGFDSGITLRENCYNCNYSKFNRVGDITIGDFWGLEESILFNEGDKKLGVSLILPTTENGLKLVESCDDIMNIEEHNFDEAISKNPHLQKPVAKTPEVDIFRNNYVQLGFENAIKKACGKKYVILLLKMKFHNFKPLVALYRIFFKKKTC